MKRYDDIGRILKNLKQLADSLSDLGISPLLNSKKQQISSRTSRPLYVSFDLGMRQRRKHYHGQILYQCIVLPNSYFDDVMEADSDHSNEFVISPSGPGMKVAEGGRYDDLVRKGTFRVGFSFLGKLFDWSHKQIQLAHLETSVRRSLTTTPLPQSLW